MIRITPSKYHEYCPVCSCCVSDGPGTCPECASPRPPSGWHPLKNTSYIYLGKELDGRYIIDRFIGSGATGEVYRGVGTRVPRPFALKIVDTRRYTGRDIEEELARRLKTEVEALGRLRNPHIVNVYEFLQIHEHIFILVMDFVDGMTLQERLDRTGRMPAKEAVAIVRQIANGLHEAHQRGIIHRDLKPDNIMIEQMPASGVFARILDFGIAHMVDNARVTAGFRGTPLYASPEQCESAQSPSTQSDVYSLGCVLFHLLSGQPPYIFDAPLAVVDAHINADIPSIYDFVSPREVSPQLDKLVGRMLAKKPNDRPADAGAVVRELDALYQHSAELPEFGTSTGEIGYEDTELGLPEVDDLMLMETLDTPRVSARRQRIVQLVAELERPAKSANITAQILSPGGNYAVLADTNQRLYLVGLKTDLATIIYPAGGQTLGAVCVSATRGDIYAGSQEQNIFRWSLDRPGAPPKKLADIGAPITSLDCNAQGFKLAVGTESGQVYSYDLRTRRLVEVYRGAEAVTVCRFIPPAGERLFVGERGGALRTISLRGDAPEFILEPLDTAPVCAAISQDGQVGALLDLSAQIRVFNLFERSAYLRVEASYAPLSALAFAPGGNLNALGMTGSHLQLWLIRHEHLVRQLAGMSSTPS